MTAIKWVLKYTAADPGTVDMYFAFTTDLDDSVLFNSVSQAIIVGVNYRTIDAFHKEAVIMQVDVTQEGGVLTVLPSKNVQDQPLPPGH